MQKAIALDVESFPDFFLITFSARKKNGDLAFRHFQMSGSESQFSDERRAAIEKILKNNLTFGYNSENYDLIMIQAALMGYTVKMLSNLSSLIIDSENPGWRVAKEQGIELPKYDHVDTINVSPAIRISLKLHAARLHVRDLQDLPIDAGSEVGENQEIVKTYCEYDNIDTWALWDEIARRIELRVQMSDEYGIDLRSKSDAQIAEAVLRDLLGVKYLPTRAKDLSGQNSTVQLAKTIQFSSDELRKVHDEIANIRFVTGFNGSPLTATGLKDRVVTIGDLNCKMGIGGLHSDEKSVYVEKEPGTILALMDVASYYPSMILREKWEPKELSGFLGEYEKIVKRRLKAKRDDDKITNEGLKIVINGTFGKLASRWSILYDPFVMLSVTLSGQLLLMMLIERLQDSGATVLSANTDGVYATFPIEHIIRVNRAADSWMKDTGLVLEATKYNKLGIVNCNNYFGIGEDGAITTKGRFQPSGISKNPDAEIIPWAVVQSVVQNRPLDIDLISQNPFTQYIRARHVRGGGEFEGEKLGRVARWYHSNDVFEAGTIRYVSSGNKVPNATCVKPVMRLPDETPDDIDYEYYLSEARDLAVECGLTLRN